MTRDMLTNLRSLRVKDLLRLEASINAELRSRGLVRTNNKPLGDIAEQVVLGARGGVLEHNSMKSHDLMTPNARKIQVKSMGGGMAGRSGKFSPFRSFDFDTAVFLVFSAETFDLMLAREVSAEAVKTAGRYSPHTNGRQITLRQIQDLGTDVTIEMQEAYEALNAEKSDGGLVASD